jgi:hypothetical protein
MTPGRTGTCALAAASDEHARRLAVLAFNWYLAHLNNATSADFFRISVVTGSTTVVFSQAGVDDVVITQS